MFNYEFPPIGGGGGWVTYFLGKHFVSVGHQVTVVTSQFQDLPVNEIVEGMNIIRVPTLRKSPDVCAVHEMMTYVVSSTYYGHSIANDFHPDIVQVFFGIPSGFCAYWLRKVRKLPYVVFLGGRDVPRINPDPAYYRWLYWLLKPVIRSIWRSADQVIACSYGLKQLAMQTDNKLPITVLPDGLELDRFVHTNRPLNSSCIRILTVGRLIPRKGFQYLIRAVPKIIQSDKYPFKIEIIGDGPYQVELKKLVHQLRIGVYIQFSGSVDYEELPRKYHRSDIFTLCSSAEGMPLVVLEAMGAGLPIVASRVQGIEDLVTYGENGYLVSAGNIEEIAEKIVALINQPHKRLQMGRASYQKVQPYDWKNIAESYLEIYQRSIGRKIEQ